MAKSDERGLFQRPPGSGIWWIRYHDENGKEKRQKIGSKSVAKRAYLHKKAEALRFKALPHERPVVVVPKERISISSLVDRYAEMTRVNLRNWKHYERYGQYWKDFIGHMDIDDVLPSHIEDYKAKRLGSTPKRHTGKRLTPVGPATVNKEVKRLGRLYELARKDKLTKNNPVRDVKLLKEPPPKERYLLQDEVRLARSHFPEYEWPIFEIGYRTGMRRQELFSLERHQVNLEADYINLPETKNSKGRKLPLSPRLKMLFREWISKQVPSRWVFPSANPEKPIDPTNWVDRVMAPSLRKAGISRVTLHTLRHTYASWLALKGVPLTELMFLLGHRSINMTMRYAHLQPGGARLYQAMLDDEP
ncbi:MAG: site-specific integrase [Vulcanimicrobiota bacterium]